MQVQSERQVIRAQVSRFELDALHYAQHVKYTVQCKKGMIRVQVWRFELDALFAAPLPSMVRLDSDHLLSAES